jgi:hypothetical protein
MQHSSRILVCECVLQCPGVCHQSESGLEWVITTSRGMSHSLWFVTEGEFRRGWEMRREHGKKDFG